MKVEQLKAQGASEEEILAAKEKAMAASDRVQEFCDETGRTRRRNREGTPVIASWKGAKTPPYGIPVANVTMEYRTKGNPGNGTVTKEHGQRQKAKQHELDTAVNLTKQIGGDVILLDNAGQESVRDCIWMDKVWEIKQAHSPKAAGKRTMLGLEQIDLTGGNLIIDYIVDAGKPDEYSLAEEKIFSSIREHANKSLDVVIMHNGIIKKIVRHKKNSD